MKVRVAFTVDADDNLRRAISNFHGRPNLATREQVRNWYERFGASMDADLKLGMDREWDL